MVVLKRIPRILSPQLLSTLARMGHGDEILLADANFPSSCISKQGNVELIRADGHGCVPLLEAIVQLLPIDTYDPTPVTLMEVSWVPDRVTLRVTMLALFQRLFFFPFNFNAFFEWKRVIGP